MLSLLAPPAPLPRAVRITEAGPYEVLLTQDGQPLRGWLLSADTAAVEGARFVPLAGLPAAGIEELQLRDQEGFVFARAYLHVPREIRFGAGLPSDDPKPTRVAKSIPRAPGTMRPEDVWPLAGARPGRTLRRAGRTYCELPLWRPEPGVPVPRGLRAYVATVGRSRVLAVGTLRPPAGTVSRPQFVPMNAPSIVTAGPSGALRTWRRQAFKRLVYAAVPGADGTLRLERRVSFGARDLDLAGRRLPDPKYDLGGYWWSLHDPAQRL